MCAPPLFMSDSGGVMRVGLVAWRPSLPPELPCNMAVVVATLPFFFLHVLVFSVLDFELRVPLL